MFPFFSYWHSGGGTPPSPPFAPFSRTLRSAFCLVSPIVTFHTMLSPRSLSLSLSLYLVADFSFLSTTDDELSIIPIGITVIFNQTFLLFLVLLIRRHRCSLPPPLARDKVFPIRISIPNPLPFDMMPRVPVVSPNRTSFVSEDVSVCTSVGGTHVNWT